MLPSLLGQVKDFINIKKKLRIDNTVFRLHYNYTKGLLLACSILVMANELIGKNIFCLGDTDYKAITTYCYIYGTYTVKDNLDKEVGSEVLSDGVGPDSNGSEIIRHNYYMWVHMVLFIQALTFHIGHLFWKVMDSSKLTIYMGNLTQLNVKKDEAEKQIGYLVNYMSRDPHNSTWWYMKYSFCEAINLIILIFNFSFTNWFLVDEFNNYGPNVIKYLKSDPEDVEGMTSPMAQVFPRTTKCTWYMYGSSGTITKHDQLCILPQNILNEKLYVVVWFWFVVLLALSGLTLIYRIFTFLRFVRTFVLMLFNSNKDQKSNLKYIVQELSAGNWFLLCLILENMSVLHMPKLIDDLKDALEHKGIDPYEPEKEKFINSRNA